MRVSLSILSLSISSACVISTPATATSYPTDTLLPTPDLESAYETFVEALQARIQVNDYQYFA